MATSESTTAVVAAFLGNAALVALKATAAVSSGSAAMLAETFHSIADSGNQVLLYIGIRLSDKPPDDAHPFGHAANTYFWAFVVSLMLFGLGGALSVWEGVRKLLRPSPHESSMWVYGVLAGAFAFETFSLVVAYRSTRAMKGRQSLVGFLIHSRDPTLPTVLLEDTAALTSILLAAAGVTLSARTGDTTWDAIASALIGLVLILVAGFLALRNYSLLIGRAAAPEIEAAARAAIARDPAVAAVLSLHTLHLGPEAVLVAARVCFRDELRAPEIATAVCRLEDAVRAVLPSHHTPRRMILIEPGLPPVPGQRSGDTTAARREAAR